MSLRFAYALALAAWAIAGDVAAQASATAEALFRAGREASTRGDHAAACAKYRESQRLEGATGTLLNIAVCEEALGELASAWQHYQEVLRALASDDVRVTLARTRLQAVEQRLPRIIVLLSPAAGPDTRVHLGAVELSHASFGVPLPVDPGAYTLRVRAAGHEDRSYAIELAEAEQRTLTLALGPKLPPARPQAALAAQRARPVAPLRAAKPAAPGARQSSVQATLGYAGLALGGVALIASGVTFGFAVERKVRVDAHCPDRMCDPFGSEAARTGNAMLLASGLSLGIAALSGAAGALLLWSQPDATESVRVGAAQGGALRVAF